MLSPCHNSYQGITVQIPEGGKAFDCSPSDEISQPDLLAKFVCAPIYVVLGSSQKRRASLPQPILKWGEPMSAICDVDLATFCGRIGNVYMRHRMCPPFALRVAVRGWIARDMPLWHCVDV